jgi:HD-like signal output (HDOD) protein
MGLMLVPIMDFKFANEHSPIDESVERIIQDIGIPPHPAIIDRVIAEMRKAAPDFSQLGQIIATDVSLSASLMKTVNSPYFGLRSKVHSVADALTMLGLDVASRAIAIKCLRASFPVTPALERFWNASAQIAALSGWLAMKVHKTILHADVAYTFGLFRDIGIAILLRRHSRYVETLFRANQETERSFTDIEQRDIHTDHARVGYVLAMNWCLPEEICLGIRSHHELLAIELPESGVPLVSQYLIATSQTAAHILQCLTGLSCTSEWRKLGPACMRILCLSEDELPAICNAGADILESVE